MKINVIQQILANTRLFPPTLESWQQVIQTIIPSPNKNFVPKIHLKRKILQL